MTRSLRRALLAAAVLPAAAAAQQPAAAGAAAGAAPATCAIDQNKPASLAKALFAVQRVQAVTDTAARHKALREAVAGVYADAGAAKSNPTGTALTLAQLQALLAQDVGLVQNATRGAIGLSGDASAKVDLLAQLDSNAKIAEAVSPACAETVGQLRQLAWLNPMNSALQAFNANKVDEAGALAERAAFIYQGSPLPWYILSNVAQQKNDLKTAEQHWTRIVAVADKDTAQQSREIRASAMFNLAATASQAADAAKGDAQKQAATTAAERARAFLAAYPQHGDAGRMQGTLARMLTLTGDKAGIKSAYAPMLAEPAKYSDLALTQAGVTASQAGNDDDAAKLFAAALEQNPYQRDALNNLAATYMKSKRFEPMLAPARRLVEVDPGNPDAYLLTAVAYQGIANSAKAPAQKKALTDSLVKYNDLSNKLPYKVSYTEFTRGDASTVVGYTVEHVKGGAAAAAKPAARGAAARPAARATAGGNAPRSFTMKVEFLDKSGAVIDTQTTSVGPLAPGESKPVKVQTAKAAAAVRYTIASA
jgi:tetratricopeptide (TPR) repeat protein